MPIAANILGNCYCKQSVIDSLVADINDILYTTCKHIHLEYISQKTN